MQTFILCVLLTLSSLRVVAEKTTPPAKPTSPPLVSSPKERTKLTFPSETALKIQVPGRPIKNSALAAKIANLFYQNKFDEIRAYFDQHPEEINFFWNNHSDVTFLMVLVDELSREREKNSDLIRYLLSKNVNVIHANRSGKNVFSLISENFYSTIPDDIVIKIVDLMIKQGTPFATLEQQISKLEQEHRAIIEKTNKDLKTEDPTRTPKAIESLQWIVTGHQKKLKTLAAARSHLEALASQEPLQQAGLPPELRNIVHEYRVGGTEQKQKSAQGSEGTAGSQAPKATGK